MRFRLGLFLGLAIGYILGAKAGKQRYEQIMSMWGTISRSEPAQQIGAEVRDVAARAGEVIEQKAAEGVEKVSEMVHSDGGSDRPNGRIPPA
jgi:hypothetical protein